MEEQDTRSKRVHPMAIRQRSVLVNSFRLLGYQEHILRQTRGEHWFRGKSEPMTVSMNLVEYDKGIQNQLKWMPGELLVEGLVHEFQLLPIPTSQIQVEIQQYTLTS